METQPSTTGRIFELIPKIMQDIEPIGKDRKAFFGSFRGIDDVYNFVGPVMAKHGVFPTLEIRSYQIDGLRVTMSLRVWLNAPDGSRVCTDKMAMGRDQKDVHAFAANIAESVGLRECLLRAFMVPIENFTLDPETEHPQQNSYSPQPGPQRPNVSPAPANGQRNGQDKPSPALPPVADLPLDDLGDGRLATECLISQVSTKTNSNGNQCHYLILPNGKSIYTFHNSEAEEARRAFSTKTPRRLVFKQTKYGYQLDSIANPADPPATQGDDSQVPPDEYSPDAAGDEPQPPQQTTDKTTSFDDMIIDVRARVVDHNGGKLTLYDIISGMSPETNIVFVCRDERIAVDLSRLKMGKKVQLICRDTPNGKFEVVKWQFAPN